MNRKLFLVALLVGLVPLPANGQVALLEDFGTEFPGPGRPGWFWWLGGGVDPGVVGNIDPFNPTFPSEISEDGLPDASTGSTSQAFKISFDTTNTTNWFWFNGGGGRGYFGPTYPAGGVTAEQGGNDPGNWIYSLDVRAVGALGDLAVQGQFTFYDPDYDTTFGVDGNGDGMVNGADTYITNFNFLDTDGDPDGFTSNAFRLDEGSTPTTAVAGDIPRFGNDGNWILVFSGGSGQYQFGNNSVTIDNIKFEFSLKPPVPGDYNDDGTVDAADFVLWRDTLGSTFDLSGNGDEMDGSEGIVDLADYEWWQASFGNDNSGVGAGAAAVPEPQAHLLAAIALLGLAWIHRR